MSHTVASFLFTASGTLSWTADQDYVLYGIVPTGATGAWLVTSDPTATSADLTGPTGVSRVLTDVHYACQGGNNKSQLNLQIPILEGTKLFVQSGVAQSVLLYLSEPLIGQLS